MLLLKFLTLRGESAGSQVAQGIEQLSTTRWGRIRKERREESVCEGISLLLDD